MPNLRVTFPMPCAEKWEAMTTAGCARVCGRCDKPVHDLSEYTFDEAEAMLRREPGTCVRARIDPDGVVALKPSRLADARRMMVAIAATAGLLTAGAPAFAKRDRPEGGIAGNVQDFGIRMRVTATGTDGQTFGTRTKNHGRFRIRHLPAGSYTLTFVPDCGTSWTIENVVVGAEETIVPDVQNENQCIVIGMLLIEENRG